MGNLKREKSSLRMFLSPILTVFESNTHCEQFTRFLETNKLLPENQHGFRAKRSTVTALTAMQKEWTKNSEDKTLRNSS